MPAAVLTADEARKAAIEVIEDGRGRQAVHDLVTALRANRRTGTACTKTRAEVSGNNKKIYRQKGTGGARHVHGAADQRAQENAPLDRSGNGESLRVRRRVRTAFVLPPARRDRDPLGANREPAWPLRVLRDAGY